jgi:hypothetical protein
MAKKSRYTFASCLYNPSRADFVKKITSGVPDFKKYSKDHEDHEKVFKWVVYTYDRQSPMVKEIPELMVRKGEAAVYAGYATNEDGQFDEEVEGFLLGKNEDINNLIVSYVSRFADPHYIMLVASWNLLLDNTRKLLSGKSSRDTYDTIKKITSDIEDMTRSVFSSGTEQDEALELKKALYSRVENDRLKLNHENIMKYVSENGALPKGFNPYGETYEVDKLVFLGDGEGDG